MSETMNIPVTVTKKLLAVMEEASYIRKDKKNDFHKYNYASEQAIKETLHPLLVKHGLLFLPVGCETVSDVETVTDKGKRERLLTIRYFYRWVDADTGEATDVLHSMGTGADSSDKAVYKGLTGAIKYILTGTFLIPTGDDPEQHQEEKKRKAEPAVAPTPIQRGVTPVLLATIKAMKADIGAQLFDGVMDKHAVKKPSDFKSEDQARKILSELGEIRSAVVAAGHGEVAKGVEEQLFNSLPEDSRAKVFVEIKNKIAKACGSMDTAVDEYERLRANCDTQWELYKALDRAHQLYVTGKIA